MKDTIFRAFKVDNRWDPARRTLVFCGDTEEETISYLEKNGGGLYENILHNFTLCVAGKNG